MVLPYWQPALPNPSRPTTAPRHDPHGPHAIKEMLSPLGRPSDTRLCGLVWGIVWEWKATEADRGRNEGGAGGPRAIR